ncbi:MAG: molybdopterin converting factor subunit 1 [Pseudomonadota bacterium]
MKVLYFAWMRHHIGKGEEDLDPPPKVATVDDLLTWLATRGEGYAKALAREDQIRVAVNCEFAERTTPLKPQDEVAIFPPVTGG